MATDHNMHNFRRTVTAKAVQLAADSLLVERGLAKATDWLVFEDGRERIVENEAFRRLYVPSSGAAREYLAALATFDPRPVKSAKEAS